MAADSEQPGVEFFGMSSGDQPDGLLGSHLSDRYQIVSELGRGAMGVVYRAHDSALQRDVAVKVIPPALMSEQARTRFEREARVVAQMDHPSIVPVYDFGEDQGTLFIVMPIVPGKTLRELMRERRLSHTEILDVGLRVAEALHYSHDHGVVHRDIKPENVMMVPGRQGSVRVSDFGLARVTTEDGMTHAGNLVGTLGYFSPEQVRGEEIDGRSDIYSFGTMLYEGVVGRPPFKGEMHTVLYAIAHELPTPPRERGVDLDPGLERLIMACLAKERSDRPPDAGAVADVMRLWQARLTADEGSSPYDFAPVAAASPASTESSSYPSIAVLPFVNLSGDPENEYFSDGLSEDLINALSKVAGLRVVSRTSASAFKGTSEDIRDVGRRLNATSILEGSVRRAGNRMRVTATLVSVHDGFQLWSERFDREKEDLFEIQDEITESIVTTLEVKLVADQRARMVKRYTDNIQAHELYLKGRYVEGTRSQSGLMRGIGHFGAAIAEDPGHALAFAGLADSHILLAWYRFQAAAEAFPQARSAAEKALGIDETLAEAHASLGSVQLFHDWDWDGARRSFERALELDPREPTALHAYSEFLAARGQLDRALDVITQAQHVDPLSLPINAGLGFVLYFRGDYEGALERYRQTCDLNPDYVFINWFLGQAYMAQGCWNKAMSSLRRGLELSRDHPGMAAYLGYALARSGSQAEAEAILEDLVVRSRGSYVAADYLSVVCLGLGRQDEALDWLEKARDERALHLVFLKVDPTFDELRESSRFTALLENIGL